MKQFLKKERNKLLILLGILLINVETLAQDYIVPANGQVVASISDKGVNRIAIENDRIAQVIGNEDEYIIESDSNLGQVFLSTELKATKEISVRFLTEREKIIDVKFTVKQIEPQTIVLKYKNEANEFISSSTAHSSFSKNSNLNSPLIQTKQALEQKSNATNDKQQIIEMIKLVYNNKVQGANLSKLSCLKQNPKLNGLKIVQATQYPLKKQTVVKAMIANNSKKEIILDPQDFSRCMTLVTAVVLNNNTLAPKANTSIYLVGRDEK